MSLHPIGKLRVLIHLVAVADLVLLFLFTLSGPALSAESEQEKAEKEELSARQFIAHASSIPSGRIPAVVQSFKSLPWSLYAQQKKERAESFVRSVLSLKKLRPHDPAIWLWWQDSLARMYLGENKVAEAETASRELVELARQIRPPDPGAVARSTSELADALYMRGKKAEATAVQRRAIESAEASPDADQAVYWQLQLAQWTYDHGDSSLPAAVCRLLITCSDKLNERQLAQAYVLAASASARQGNFTDADGYLKQAVDLVSNFGAPGDWRPVENAVTQLGAMYSAHGHTNATAGQLQTALKQLQKS